MATEVVHVDAAGAYMCRCVAGIGPELRCYVKSGSAAATEAHLGQALAALQAAVDAAV
ncbi:MAG: hypothetical protein AAGA15_00135 [Pseudomonadota bacterium]